MAGLADLSKTTETQTTSLPSWYTTAQQNVVNQAQQAQAPTLAQTAGGQQALGAFQTGQPYQQAASTLGSIASGAANPWTVTTGPGGAQTVTPNVATPMGGLFKSQTDYLTSMMPELSAGPTGRAIGTGQFGSSSNEAAVARARAQAINQLFQQQNQAALQSQQTGATAAGALGTLGQSQLQGALNLATAEQASPYQSLINQANIIGKMNQPGQTQTKVTQPDWATRMAGYNELIKGGKSAYNQLMNSNLAVGAKNFLSDLFKQGGVDTSGWTVDPATGLYISNEDIANNSGTQEEWDLTPNSGYSGGLDYADDTGGYSNVDYYEGV